MGNFKYPSFVCREVAAEYIPVRSKVTRMEGWVINNPVVSASCTAFNDAFFFNSGIQLTPESLVSIQN